jgi:hypothetical protein
MPKITYSELLDKVRDPKTSDEELRQYFTIETGLGGFDFKLEVDPQRVTMSRADEELESAMKIGNGIARLRRRLAFFDRVDQFPERPILVSEGDSWFQFPLLIDDTIDHLSKIYNIWSLDAAGDTLANMVYGQPGPGGFEFIAGLRRHQDKVRAFLFSGAGNDIIGEDPRTNLPMLEALILPFSGDQTDIEAHIDADKLAERLKILRIGYRRIVDLVRQEPGLERLPIIFHGYDYPFPFPFGDVDQRNPIYARKDQWLGRAMAARNISEESLRRGIIKYLIDELYRMLEALISESGVSNVWIVDCRGALPAVSDWNDEIHGTSQGFSRISERFRQTIDRSLSMDQ